VGVSVLSGFVMFTTFFLTMVLPVRQTIDSFEQNTCTLMQKKLLMTPDVMGVSEVFSDDRNSTLPYFKSFENAADATAYYESRVIGTVSTCWTRENEVKFRDYIEGLHMKESDTLVGCLVSSAILWLPAVAFMILYMMAFICELCCTMKNTRNRDVELQITPDLPPPPYKEREET